MTWSERAVALFEFPPAWPSALPLLVPCLLLVALPPPGGTAMSGKQAAIHHSNDLTGHACCLQTHTHIHTHVVDLPDSYTLTRCGPTHTHSLVCSSFHVPELSM